MSEVNIEPNQFSEALNKQLVQAFLESEKKKLMDNRAKEFLNGILNDKGNNLSFNTKESIVEDCMSLFRSLSSAVARETVNSIQETLFEKTMIDGIRFLDLPFIDKIDEEQARKDLLENVLEVSVEMSSEQTLQTLATIMSASIILGWNRLRTAVDLNKESVTIYNLISSATEIFYNEAFSTKQVEEIKEEPTV